MAEEFIRARSPEQKEQRMREIKEAADALFETRPYHEITLSTIADRLSWTRANLYRYVSTKEEIYLEITEEKMSSYYGALMSAVPEGCGYSDDTLADVWSGIINAHTDYFRYGGILASVIETNVSLERLAAFKRRYFELSGAFSDRLAAVAGVTKERAYWIQTSVFYHAVGMTGVCSASPLILEAIRMAGIDYVRPPLKESMRDFIIMNLGHRER